MPLLYDTLPDSLIAELSPLLCVQIPCDTQLEHGISLGKLYLLSGGLPTQMTVGFLGVETIS